MAKQWILHIVLLLLCIQVCLSKTRKSIEVHQHKSVVEANHYYSEKQKSTKFNVDNVIVGRPLVLILKRKDTDKVGTISNPPTFKLKSGKQSSDCEFERYEELCTISNIQDTDLKMEISCKQLPCQASWIIYQPVVKDLLESQKAQDLYDLKQSNNHMMAIITCNDPTIKTLNEDVAIYSESLYHRSYTKSAVYYLFNNQEKGLMYIDIKEGSKQCAELKIFNVPKELKFQNQKPIKDFIMKESPSVFSLEKKSEKDFRIDASIHSIDQQMLLASNIHAKLTAKKGSTRQIIAEQIIKPIAKKKNIDFTFSFKKVSADYTDLQVQFETQDLPTAINIYLTEGNQQEIGVGEINYFNLKKGQSLTFVAVPESEASEKDKIYLYHANNNKLKITPEFKSCPANKGCEFTIEALQDLKEFLYLSTKEIVPEGLKEEGKQKKDEDTIQFLPLKEKVKMKVSEGDNVYFRKEIKANQAFQVVVNTPNVIVFAASKEKCAIPGEECYERHGNIHKPFIYEPKKDGQLLFNVEGLDNCEFVLTIIQANAKYIELKDSEPMSYVMDESQGKVVFKYKLSSKQEVSFNLIAPVNTVNLLVNNGEEEPTDDSPDLSSEGYISYSKEQIDSLTFTIVIQKTDTNKLPLSHFSIIVSTEQSNLRLQAGTAHYQTLPPQAHRDYVFEFQPKQRYLINFYTHNLKTQSINLELLASNKGNWDTNQDFFQKMVIDREADVLDLADVSEKLCAKQGQTSCEIFIRIINTMEVEVDLTVTLLVRQSIIELKDGLWQSFHQNEVTVSSNFYYYPKNADKNIVIMYKSFHSDLRMIYTIWKTDTKSLYISSWPFPKVPETSQKMNSQYKPISSVSIDHAVIKEKCWPNCVLLITLFKDDSIKDVDNFAENTQFRIMASDTQIQLPENTKITLALKKDEEKHFLVDLKYALEKEELAFYTSNSIGFHSMKANVYSERQPRCPTDQDLGDFYFGDLETEIKISVLKEKLKANQMEDDKNIFLCVTTHAFQDTKLSVEYTTSSQGFKRIQQDSFETVTLKKKQPKFFRIDGFMEFYLKIIRNNGFPFIYIKKCEEKGNLKECIQDLKKSQQKGKQIVTKTQSFNQKPCSNCHYLIKVYTQESAEITLHLQSKYTELELKENQMVTDFVNENEENRYLITAVRKEETIINIHVLEGEVEVNVLDFNKIKLHKVSDAKNTIVHFAIPSADHLQNKETNLLGQALMSAYALSQTFNFLHVTIKSKDPKIASYFTISYSSGERQLYLQDGLIVDYKLESNKLNSFYYVNQHGTDHIYFTISAPDSNSLTKLKIKTYYLTNPSDETSKIQFVVERPPMRKKTPNPTILMSLPKQSFFIFQLQNVESKDFPISIGINHQEVILLPFGHEYPFTLHSAQEINLLVDVNIVGFLKITIRKCDESEPQFGYTFDYDTFIKGQYTYQTNLNDDPKFQYLIKANQIGTLYIHVKSQPQESSLLTVRVDYSTEKVKKDIVKAGGKGLLQYQLIDSKTAEVSFSGVVCSQKKCSSDVRYYSLSSSNLQQLYTQLICPANFFAITEAKSSNPLPLTKIQTKDSTDKITFRYEILDHISYIGVKAVYDGIEEVYYKPTEIITIWGQLSRTSQSHKITIGTAIVISLIALLVFVRKNARKGYKPLDDGDN